MKILILGTSNSIKSKGWVDGLKAACPDAIVDNRSVGGSPGSQFACLMQESFSAYDFVVFDSVPNDEVQADEVGGTVFLNSLMYETLSTIASQSRLIVLGFCLSRFLIKRSSIFLWRRRLARLCRAQFIDVGGLAHRYGLQIHPNSDTIYEDEAHPHKEISYFIGHRIGQALRTSNAFWIRHAISNSYAENFSVFDPVVETSHLRIDRRKNSLFSADFVVIGPSESVSIPRVWRDFPNFCLGMYINRFNTSAILRLENDKSKRDVRMNFFFDDPKWEIRFFPLKNGFPVDRIRVISKETFVRDGNKAEARASIGKLVFWRGSGDHKFDDFEELYDIDILHRSVEQIIKSDLMSKLPACNDNSSQFTLAQFHYSVGDWSSALTSYGIANRNSAYTLEQKKEIARTLNRLGRYQDSYAIFSTLEMLDSQDIELVLEFVLAMTALEKYQEAVDFLKSKALQSPSAAAIHEFLGQLEWTLDLKDDAIRSLQKAVCLEPSRKTAFIALAEMFYWLGDFDPALEIYDSLSKLIPKYAMIHLRRGTILLQKQSLMEAVRALSLAVRLDPDLLEAKYRLSLALTAVGRSEEAHHYEEELISVGPFRQTAADHSNNLPLFRWLQFGISMDDYQYIYI